MQYFKIAIYFLLFLCAIEDLRMHRIKNIYIVMLLALEGLQLMLWGTCADAEEGLLAGGILFGFFLLLYCLRMIGAGDVKLFGTVGIFVGMHRLEVFLVATFACAGVFSICKMLWFGTMKKRFLYLREYIRGYIMTRQVVGYGIPERRHETMGMALPILLGMLIMEAAHQ